MVFRVAVREVEAWLLADRPGIANLIGAHVNQVPARPEQLDDPKQHLLQLAKRYARGHLKNDLIRMDGTNIKQGVGYNNVLSEFVLDKWSLDTARQNANSLERTICRMEELVASLRILEYNENKN
jgi:hypothetical protein